MYSVLRYLRICHNKGPIVIANPTRTKGKPNNVKKSGAPAEAAPHIQKMAKLRKIKPNGIAAVAGSTNAFFSGLPFQRIFSFAFNSLSILDD
jgi:hypothetical protein